MGANPGETSGWRSDPAAKIATAVTKKPPIAQRMGTGMPSAPTGLDSPETGSSTGSFNAESTSSGARVRVLCALGMEPLPHPGRAQDQSDVYSGKSSIVVPGRRLLQERRDATPIHQHEEHELGPEAQLDKASSCKALPYENVKFHGISVLFLFMQFK